MCFSQKICYQFIGIIDYTDGGNGIKAQMGADEQGLRVNVADAAKAAAAVEVLQVVFKLGAEGGVLDIVDLPLISLFEIVDAHAAAFGAEVGVIVYAEKDVEHDVAP